MPGDHRYGRVLLKLSGEALAGDRGFGIEPLVVDRLTDEIKAVYEMGVSLGVVIAVPKRAGRGWTGCRRTTWACWPP